MFAIPPLYFRHLTYSAQQNNTERCQNGAVHGDNLLTLRVSSMSLYPRNNAMLFNIIENVLTTALTNNVVVVFVVVILYLNELFNELGSSICFVLYSRTSMARTSLGPWKFVRDVGSSSH